MSCFNRSDVFYFCGMYSKAEASQLTKEFWTSFGKYMSPVLSAEGENIGWVNYKTGKRNVSFRMRANPNSATVSLEFNHADLVTQLLYFEQAASLKNFLSCPAGCSWDWQLFGRDENGKTVSKIYKDLHGVSIYKKENWPELISFFKRHIICLDEFWSHVKFGFDALEAF